MHIPRRYPFPSPGGEYQTACDYCGITWYRSSLVRDESGFLACPDDQEGRCTATLARLEQEAIAEASNDMAGIRREPW